MLHKTQRRHEDSTLPADCTLHKGVIYHCPGTWGVDVHRLVIDPVSKGSQKWRSLEKHVSQLLEVNPTGALLHQRPI